MTGYDREISVTEECCRWGGGLKGGLCTRTTAKISHTFICTLVIQKKCAEVILKELESGRGRREDYIIGMFTQPYCPEKP